jgi:hypothetical protein
MASTDDADADAAAGDAPTGSVAATLRSASFVTVVAHADGAAVAAAGLLAEAADAVDVPFHICVARTATEVGRRVDGTEDATTLVVGDAGTDADIALASARAPLVAFESARDVGAEPDPTLALAGLNGADRPPEGSVPIDAADTARRPGVAGPTEDLVDTLAHSTLVHGSFSGDPEAAKAALGEAGLADESSPETRRRAGSLVALEASTAATGERGLAALGRALNGRGPAGSFATAAGLGDVLDAAVRVDPGTAVALALGHDVRDDALAAWREHARRAHEAIRATDPTRHRGLVVAEAGDGSVWTVARLLRDFRSAEPVALAVGDAEAALAGPPGTDAAAVLASAAAECSGSGAGSDTRAYARFEGPTEDLVAVLRGQL